MNGYPQIDVDKTGGPRNGWIYIVEAEVNNPPAGSDADIVMHYSSNGGANWSAGVRVNQDPLNNGRLQFFPIVTVDDNGGVNVVYYDNRNTADSCEVWLSHSTDGGTSWHDYQVSDHRLLPKGAAGGQSHMGDHIGMVCANCKLYPMWMDDHNSTPAVFQIYCAIIDACTIGIRTISTNVPSGYALQQNYPNPFNPSTKIRFSIPPSKGVRGMTGEDVVQIKIYDILGREIETILNQTLQPGTYEVEWNAANFPSGAYFYKLTSGNFSQSRKMVLMK